MAVYKREYRSKSRAVWYYQFHHDGHKHAKAGFASKAQAEEAERRRRTELKSRMSRPVPKADVTLEQFMPVYMRYRNMDRSESGAKREARRGRQVAKVLGNRTLRGISTGDIQDYVMRRKREDCLANRSINLELVLLRGLFRHAVDNGYAEDNPAKRVKNLKESPTKRPEFFLPHFLEFVKAAETAPTARVFVPWVWFRAYTGTRPSESVFLEWRDIDFDKGHIHIVPKPGNPLKTGEARVVDMHESLRPILLGWREEWEGMFRVWRKRRRRRQPHDWVFPNPCDLDERAQTFRKAFEHAKRVAAGAAKDPQDRAVLESMSSHTFRHFFISMHVMARTDLMTIAAWVGHANTRMIEKIYGHLSNEHRQSQMANLRLEDAEEPKEVQQSSPGQVGFDDVAGYLSREYGVQDSQLLKFITKARKANSGPKKGKK